MKETQTKTPRFAGIGQPDRQIGDLFVHGIRVGRELGRIAETRGYPCMVVSDNGTELISNVILK